jgi:hypothetical protein
VRRFWLYFLLFDRLFDDEMVSSQHIRFRRPLFYRWTDKFPRLLYYTPAASTFRLITAGTVNYILSTAALEFSGATSNEQFLLPAWTGIATVRTGIILNFAGV